MQIIDKKLTRDFAGRCCERRAAFTLIELMAVVLIIIILAAIGIKVATSVQRRMTAQLIKTQMAAIQTGLDNYRSDFGYYPSTGPIRISGSGVAESSNNWVMYKALYTSGKRYVNIPVNQIKVSPTTGWTNIIDFFDTPYYYYNSPTTALSLTLIANNGSYLSGGQKNKTMYDLFSLGPDHATYIFPGLAVPLSAGDCALDTWRNWVGIRNDWTTGLGALDDITNWGQ